MAKARKCDICRSFYDEYEFNGFGNTIIFASVDNKNKYSHVKVSDACPNCMDAILSLCDSLANKEKESEPT